MKSRKISLTDSPDGLFVKLVGPSPLGPPTTPQKISSVKKTSLFPIKCVTEGVKLQGRRRGTVTQGVFYLCR